MRECSSRFTSSVVIVLPYSSSSLTENKSTFTRGLIAVQARGDGKGFLSSTVSSVWHMLGISFLGALPDHRCVLPHNVPVEDGIPKVPNEQTGSVYSNCRVYINSTINNATIDCDEWVYDDSVYGETIVTEWDLVCEKDKLVEMSQAIFMTGVMIGSVLVGQLSDRFGRRIIWLSSLWIQILVSVVTAFSQSFIMFTILRFVIGVLEQGVDIVSYVMVSEMFSPRRRAHATILLTLFWATGIMLLPWMALLIRDWRWLQLAITLPWLLTLPLWWFLPESTRWLISRGRIDEAEKILQQVARFNKTNVPCPILSNNEVPNKPEVKISNKKQEDSDTENQETEEQYQSNYTIYDLFKTKNIRKVTLLMIFIWWVNSLVYYGLSLNTGALSGNPYMNFFLSGLVEIPAYIACPFIIQRFGRRLPVCIFHIVGGVACIATAFIPQVTENGEDLTALILTTAMIGKFGITASYAIVFLYTTELYPTVIRNLGVGVSSFSSRIGGIIAPFMLLLDQYVRFLPLVTFGIFSVLAGICVLLLPETLGRTQPMTIQEVEEAGSIREQINDGEDDDDDDEHAI